MVTITKSVGRSAGNKPIDVMAIQILLSKNAKDSGLTGPLAIDGIVTEPMLKAIEAFQAGPMKSKKPDGRIDVGGGTLKKLASVVGTKTTYQMLRACLSPTAVSTVTRPGDLSSTVSIIDAGTFLPLYDRQFGQLGATAREGLTELVGFINADFDVMDVGWVAYMLATVKHECANRWKPIREFGRGSGKDYGNPVTVKDAQGKSHTNTYYGRGYVQLTWQDNYKNLGNALGYGDELMINADKALEPEVAYKVMSYGMRNGSFSTKKHKLADYITDKTLDYKHARRIINLLDQYTTISGYAEELEMLLRVSCYGSWSDTTK